MNAYVFELAGRTLHALPQGALWCPDSRTLTVSDLHLGKSDRIARRRGLMLPPYETRETLERLDALIEATHPNRVICLGDSFDDLDAMDSLDEAAHALLTRAQAGRDWIWIEGNHDPGPVNLGGRHLRDFLDGPLTYRHIATSATGEISGHYHPKCGVRGGTRPAFLIDHARVILPAFGAYTGGLRGTAAPLRRLMADDAVAVLTGRVASPVPLAATL